ncbi:flagellar assembly protein FliW [Sporolactobacillus sp. Y61]|uniref:Flagellar assembly factor FliW n=1 Tax=Sporolactobacillus sp. Y61 TaxID=3160863 RepID=A0AAU8IBG4_9BACL
MNIQTKYYGMQQIDEQQIISFSSGLPGFADDKRFIIQPFGEAFSILQSVDHPDVAFIITSPFLFFNAYSIHLPDVFVRQLDVRSRQEVSVWVIVSVQDPFTESTVNLKAPVIINTRKKTGKQYIPDHSPYSLRQRLTDDVAAKRA